jgi:hypothetical protein
LAAGRGGSLGSAGGGGCGGGWGGIPYFAAGRVGQPVTASPSETAVSAPRVRRLKPGSSASQNGQLASPASTWRWQEGHGNSLRGMAAFYA